MPFALVGAVLIVISGVVRHDVQVLAGREDRRGDVWFGAIAIWAVLFFGKDGIGLYLGKAGYLFLAAGSLVAFVVWLYYSGQSLFFGAELTKVIARHAGRQIEPAKNAEPAKSVELSKPSYVRI